MTAAVSSRRGLFTFLALTFGVSWAIEIGLRPAGVPFPARAVAAMFVPALAAYLVRGPLLREGFDDAGLRFGRARGTWRIYLLAYACVPLCLATGAMLSLATGVQHYDPSANIRELALENHIAAPPHGISSGQLLLGLLATLSIALPINMLFTFGEEFGWRGYLLPRLTASFGRLGATIATGIIWGVWHAPLIVLDGFNYPNDRLAGAGMMVLLCISISLLFSVLRYRSGSVWPSTLAHAAMNAQAGLIFVAFIPAHALAGAPIGVIGIAAFACAGIAAFAINERMG